MKWKIKNKQVKKLEYWKNAEELEYDYIYIVNLGENKKDYNIGVFLGEINGEIKKISTYDVGYFGNLMENDKGYFRFDFELVEGGIKVWSGTKNKIRWVYGGGIID